jgi:hypothetical protein
MSETQLLAALLDRKHECLVQMRDLGARQLEMIETGDMTMLMKVLSAKQGLINNLNAVERELDPYRDQSPEHRAWSSESERERCAQLAARCQLLFSEIVRLERESESQLTLERDDAERRLRGMHAAAQAHGAYAFETSLLTGSLDLSTQS